MDSSDDEEVIKEIRDEGIECISMNTRISSKEDETSIAKEIFDII